MECDQSFLQLIITTEGFDQSCEMILLPRNPRKFEHAKNVSSEVRNAMTGSSIKNSNASALVWRDIQLFNMFPTCVDALYLHEHKYFEKGLCVNLHIKLVQQSKGRQAKRYLPLAYGNCLGNRSQDQVRVEDIRTLRPI